MAVDVANRSSPRGTGVSDAMHKFSSAKWPGVPRDSSQGRSGDCAVTQLRRPLPRFHPEIRFRRSRIDLSLLPQHRENACAPERLPAAFAKAAFAKTSSTRSLNGSAQCLHQPIIGTWLAVDWPRSPHEKLARLGGIAANPCGEPKSCRDWQQRERESLRSCGWNAGRNIDCAI